VGLPALIDEISKCSQKSSDLKKLETEGLPKQKIAIDVGDHHDTTPGHGWAISDRRTMSTLA
jgi:hypothetical protein